MINRTAIFEADFTPRLILIKLTHGSTGCSIRQLHDLELNSLTYCSQYVIYMVYVEISKWVEEMLFLYPVSLKHLCASASKQACGHVSQEDVDLLNYKHYCEIIYDKNVTSLFCEYRYLRLFVNLMFRGGFTRVCVDSLSKNRRRFEKSASSLVNFAH